MNSCDGSFARIVSGLASAAESESAIGYGLFAHSVIFPGCVASTSTSRPVWPHNHGLTVSRLVIDYDAAHAVTAGALPLPMSLSRSNASRFDDSRFTSLDS